MVFEKGDSPSGQGKSSLHNQKVTTKDKLVSNEDHNIATNDNTKKGSDKDIPESTNKGEQSNTVTNSYLIDPISSRNWLFKCHEDHSLNRGLLSLAAKLGILGREHSWARLLTPPQLIYNRLVTLKTPSWKS
ncbi:hypothetical protein GIB67_011651 [Kingdonia uniflora]|uniref:Uncharacterized protein n=1 Tax=Kingdonia uniflora TaxID=39325 RepID=A0A7J7NAB7_9MAGN|nr:hypothetical protein GIB67_011651 [Kingdonia uniflora]